MRIRLRSSQAVVTIAAVALPVLHLAGHRHHHHGGSRPAHARATPGKASPTGTGTSSSGTSSTGTSSTGTAQPNTVGSQATTPRRRGAGHRRHRHGSSARPARHHHLRIPLALNARSARDPGDTISDYKFTPASLTIHVGDTVTWTNAGPASHTATADNHSFDTGVLAKGASASHTFTTAGTFSYFCTIHPFMKGTIVVLAPTTTSTPSTTPGTTTTPTTSSSAGGLPNTGLDLAATVLIGLLLGGVGLLMRRPARTVPQSESGEGRTPDR